MMSNIGLILEEKSANIGNFLVGRLLPFREKRAVGPFVFIDHMGPVALKDFQNLDVPAHPHIGLSTLTYLFEGAIFHRDSLGNALEINPGAVNWMTAGKGVVHSERTPEYLRQTEKNLHGFQIWIALPKEMEETDPSFAHIPAEDLPVWQQDQLNYKLIAGSLFQKKAPVPVHSDLYFLEIKADVDSPVNIGPELYGEVGMYVLEGSVVVEGQEYGSKQLMIAKDANLCQFEIKAGTTLYLFGGTPFPEERYIFWNFVHSDPARIEQAKADWQAQNHAAFPLIPGDDQEYVPLPNLPRLKQ